MMRWTLIKRNFVVDKISWESRERAVVEGHSAQRWWPIQLKGLLWDSSPTEKGEIVLLGALILLHQDFHHLIQSHPAWLLWDSWAAERDWGRSTYVHLSADRGVKISPWNCTWTPHIVAPLLTTHYSLLTTQCHHLKQWSESFCARASFY